MKTIRNRVEVLIFHRETKKILVAKWVKKDSVQCVFPGGGIEEDETVAKAAYKECLEEVGIKIDQVSEVHRGPIDPHPDADQSNQIHFRGSQTVYVSAVYADKDYSKHNCEGDAMQYEWCDPLIASASVRDGSIDGEHRAQAVRNLLFINPWLTNS